MGCYRQRILPRNVNANCGIRRLEPLQKRLFGGCHLTRPIVDLLIAAGFTVTELDVFYEPGTTKVSGADSLGIAVPGRTN